MTRRVVIIAWLALAACEPRVAEPGPTPASASGARATPTTVADGPADKSAAKPTKAPPPKRCIRETPAEAPRPLVTGADPNCPDDPVGNPALKHATVKFEQEGLSLDVELARQPVHRQRGLMYRKSLPPDQGMLFVFNRRRVHTFWMKNTCISLDMLFIDRDGLIVGIEENVPTMNTNSYHVGCPSTYVLEVNAGWSRRNGVKAGQKVTFEGLET